MINKQIGAPDECTGVYPRSSFGVQDSHSPAYIERARSRDPKICRRVSCSLCLSSYKSDRKLVVVRNRTYKMLSVLCCAARCLR